MTRSTSPVSAPAFDARQPPSPLPAPPASGGQLPAPAPESPADARDRIVPALVAAGVAAVVLTELLSALHWLTRAGVAGGWLVAALAAALVARRRGAPSAPAAAAPWRPGSEGALWLGITGVVLGVTLLTALVAAPNSWDAMTYHLARVAHWVQNRSVAHYPTEVTRQLHMGPFAEYVILQLQLLTGGDRLANAVEWGAALASLVLVSLIARELGASRLGQCLAVGVAATVPMGVAQASSTQTDHVVALWIACAVFLVLVARRSARPTVRTAVPLGAALGLAALTKATAYLFAFPFLVWLVVELRGTVRPLLRAALVAALVALALNVPSFARNVRTYGSPLGPGAEGRYNEFHYTNESFAPPAVYSNVVRNLAYEARLPFDAADRRLQRAAVAAHTALGLDPSDPRTTWHGAIFDLSHATFAEDQLPSPAHLLLLLGAGAVVAATAGERRGRTARRYALALLGAFLLFCAVLRWQPWHPRLLLPLFVLGAPICGLALERRASAAARTAVLALLVASMLPTLLWRPEHPLLGERSIFRVPRAEQYFAVHPELAAPYAEAVRVVAATGCRRVGIAGNPDSWEYPLWRLLPGAAEGTTRLEYVAVRNPSRRYASEPRFAAFHPCAVVAIGEQWVPRIRRASGFRLAWRGQRISVLLPPPSAPPRGASAAR